MSKRVIIVQARMTSSRLPGKVLRPLAGRPMLAQQLSRLKQCQASDDIVVATTNLSTDDPVADLARAEGVGCFRGSENDVLTRFFRAAVQATADVVVRVTGDCPLVDSLVVDRVIGALVERSSTCDYASNVLERTFPRGLDVEAFFMDVLARCHRLASSTAAREHVTLLPRSEMPQLFLCHSVVDVENNADLRWTVDTEADLRMVELLYERLGLDQRYLPYRDVLSYVRSHPEISALNNGIETWSPVTQS
jgi:spore coat polysaccharide biosynthesis protein SpsF